ncbi:MAG: hypothetical protein FJ279_18635 [Planctomycetes bacterium]|nr:hypothetical protein [Planctomycetota bacterium]
MPSGVQKDFPARCSELKDAYVGARDALGSIDGWPSTMEDIAHLPSVLDGDPPLAESLRQVDENGGPFTAPPQLSWQSEYDRPELAEYLRIKNPQP